MSGFCPRLNYRIHPIDTEPLPQDKDHCSDKYLRVIVSAKSNDSFMSVHTFIAVRGWTASRLRKQLFQAGCVLLLVVLAAGSLPAQRGAITLPQNLDKLVEEAAIIVRGHVVSAGVEPHPELANLSTLVVTLRVEETLKGQASSTFTFRQFIWDVRDRFDDAGYYKGQHLLLLMIKPSALGLSSPAGLEQGRFRIVRNPEGNLVAVNGHGNAGLFHELAPQLRAKGVPLAPRLAALVEQPTPGPVPLDDLRKLIRLLAGSK